jgi:heme A synthase
LIWTTMIIGAAVSSTHSGGVCGGLLSCDGVWMPSPKVDVQQHLHMQHRLFALLTTLLVIGLTIAIKRTAPHLRQAALRVHMGIWGQVILGILTLYSFAHYPSYYYALSIAHLGWGSLLLLAALALVLQHAAPASKISKK